MLCVSVIPLYDMTTYRFISGVLLQYHNPILFILENTAVLFNRQIVEIALKYP